MPAPLVAAAIVSAKASLVKDMAKGIRQIGEKILSELLGCRIKPKGTPHDQIAAKAPKYFAAYGVGVPESPKFQPNNRGDYRWFEPITGYVLSVGEIEKILPIQDRRAIEATLRKKCERVTGSLAYYVEMRNPATFRGFVRLSDGLVYDGSTYALDGGPSANSPKDFSSVKPKTLPGQETVNDAGEKKPNKQLAGMGGGFGMLALVGLGIAVATSQGK